MDIPSRARSPCAPVFFNLSLPARSTKCNLLSTVTQLSLEEPDIISIGTDRRFSRVEVGAAGDDFFWTRFRLKTACEREDLALTAVASVCRIAEPKLSISAVRCSELPLPEEPKLSAPSISSTELIGIWVRPVRRMRPSRSSRMFTWGLSLGATCSGISKSRSCSL